MLKKSAKTIAILAMLNASAEADPLEKPVVGPKLICFKYSTFLLNAGESVVDFSGSTEIESITIQSPSGEYEIAESEIWAPPNDRGTPIFVIGNTRTYRNLGSNRGYTIYGPTSFDEAADLPILKLSGSALTGTSADHAILARFDVRDPKTAKCKMTFTYSW